MHYMFSFLLRIFPVGQMHVARTVVHLYKWIWWRSEIVFHPNTTICYALGFRGSNRTTHAHERLRSKTEKVNIRDIKCFQQQFWTQIEMTIDMKNNINMSNVKWIKCEFEWDSAFSMVIIIAFIPFSFVDLLSASWATSRSIMLATIQVERCPLSHFRPT